MRQMLDTISGNASFDAGIEEDRFSYKQMPVLNYSSILQSKESKQNITGMLSQFAEPNEKGSGRSISVLQRTSIHS